MRQAASVHGASDLVGTQEGLVPPGPDLCSESSVLSAPRGLATGLQAIQELTEGDDLPMARWFPLCFQPRAPGATPLSVALTAASGHPICPRQLCWHS